MKVSFFENIHSITPKGRDKEVYYYLDRIKEGKSDSILSKIRVATTKEDKSKLKKLLPVVAFGGRFVQRSIQGLKEPSGLATIDIDDSKDIEKARAKLKEQDGEAKGVWRLNAFNIQLLGSGRGKPKEENNFELNEESDDLPFS